MISALRHEDEPRLPVGPARRLRRAAPRAALRRAPSPRLRGERPPRPLDGRGRRHPVPLRGQRVPVSRDPRRIRGAAGLAGRVPGRGLDDPEPGPVLRPGPRPGAAPAPARLPVRDGPALLRPARRARPGGGPARDRLRGRAGAHPLPEGRDELRLRPRGRPRCRGAARGRQGLRGHQIRRGPRRPHARSVPRGPPAPRGPEPRGERHRRAAGGRAPGEVRPARLHHRLGLPGSPAQPRAVPGPAPRATARGRSACVSFPAPRGRA